MEREEREETDRSPQKGATGERSLKVGHFGEDLAGEDAHGEPPKCSSGSGAEQPVVVLPKGHSTCPSAPHPSRDVGNHGIGGKEESV